MLHIALLYHILCMAAIPSSPCLGPSPEADMGFSGPPDRLDVAMRKLNDALSLDVHDVLIQEFIML